MELGSVGNDMLRRTFLIAFFAGCSPAGEVSAAPDEQSRRSRKMNNLPERDNPNNLAFALYLSSDRIGVLIG